MAIEPTKYETLYLVRPDISPEDLLTIQNRVEQSVAGNGGEMIKFEKWAERDLAYRIENYTRGTYYIAVYASDPGAVTDIERYFNLSKNNILRFMTVKYLEEQKPADAVISAPPQASEPEDQSAFQSPPSTPESQAEGSTTAEQPQEAKEQPQEAEEQAQEAEEQAQEAEEQPQEAEEQPQEAEEQAQEAKEQPQEVEEQPQEVEEQAQEAKEQPQEVEEQAQKSEEQAEESQEQPQENEKQTEGGSES